MMGDLASRAASSVATLQSHVRASSERWNDGVSRGGFTAGVCDVHGRAGGDVDGGEREALGAGVGEELEGTRKVSLGFRAIAAGLPGSLGMLTLRTSSP